MSKKVSVIIPMYNEEKNAARCVKSVMRVITKLSEVELIVVNDGSKDSTGEILKKLVKNHSKFSIVDYKKNKGYGGALQEGIKNAIKQEFDYALFMDSDLTNNPNDIIRFVKKIYSHIDCVKASRYIKGGGTKNVPFKRRAISRIGNILASFLFNMGVKDCTNGFRMVKLELLRDIKYREKGFSIILEELYYLKKKRAKISEIPVTLNSRLDTKSSFRYNLKTFYNYMKYPILSLFV